MQDIILFGIQGCGKGTQAKILASKFVYKIFETGAELRTMAESGSALGNKVKAVIESGKLVDADIIMEIVQSFLNNLSPDQAVIFDGIPRSIEQMTKFETIIKSTNRLPIGINIQLSKQEALNRILGRFICAGIDTTINPLITEEQCIALGGKVIKRKDDNHAAIEVRINAFFTETQPVINEYKLLHRLIEIDGSNDFNNVTEAIIRSLSKKC